MLSLSRPSSLLFFGLLSLAACAPPVEASDEGAGAAAQTASAQLRFVSAAYDASASVVVVGNEVRGMYKTSLGTSDCSFAFSGIIRTEGAGQSAAITVTDGWDTLHGTLRTQEGTGAAPKLVFDLPELPNACARSWGDRPIELTEADPSARPTGIAGFAPVGAGRAWFYDGPGTGMRNVYVARGDIVAIKTISGDTVVRDGFVQAEYTAVGGRKTTGWLLYSELHSPWATGE